jgi:FkbM family methyltransferase
MIKSLVLTAARRTPAPIKKWVHSNRFLDRLARKTFSSALGVVGDVVSIESGPLAGINLVVSEHVSHAHVSGSYELETTQAIDSLIVPGAICYDLGASIGYMSLLMARKAKRVFAFEPAPHAAAEIRKHAAANNFKNIIIVESPVSDCEREVEFALTDVAYGSAIVESKTEWPTLKLKTITLDEFVADHPFPDFVKMDVEGEEGRVLHGARTILRERKTLFCCELHTVEATHQVQDIFLEYGYRLTTLDGQPFHFAGQIIRSHELQVLALPQ